MSSVFLLKSIFEDRPKTIFFQYPKVCGKQRSNGDWLVGVTQKEFEESTFAFKLTEFTIPYNCVINSIKTAGLR